MKLRLHQYLSRAGIFNGKKGLIESVRNGEVSVGGQVVINPEFIFDPSRKKVFWKGEFVKPIRKSVYILVNKPEGCLSSRLTPTDIRLGKKSVFELIEKLNVSAEVKNSLFCVGRLDEDTSGLLVLTNDGKLGSKLTDPLHGIRKKYLASLERPISTGDLDKLRAGVVINLEENGKVWKYRTKGCSIVRIAPRQLEIILSEGKKREVRRMLEVVGNRVVGLQRVAIGRLSLGMLKLEKGGCSFADSKALQLLGEE